MNSVLIGMFESESDAMRARGMLLNAGFTADAVAVSGGATSHARPATLASDAPQHEGAIARFFNAIFGDDDDERAEARRDGRTDVYDEAFRRGSYGVSVVAGDDAQAGAAEHILNDCGAFDIDAKAQSWRREGWTGGGGGDAAATRAPQAPSAADPSATRKFQEVEEELHVGKRVVARGGVRVYTRMTEAPVSETVRLREEHASVSRTAVDRAATPADLEAFKEGSLEVREMAEEAVVSKTARVTGEVEVGKTTSEREQTVQASVRKTHVDVEPIAGDTRPDATAAAPGAAHATPPPAERG